MARKSRKALIQAALDGHPMFTAENAAPLMVLWNTGEIGRASCRERLYVLV